MPVRSCLCTARAREAGKRNGESIDVCLQHVAGGGRVGADAPFIPRMCVLTGYPAGDLN